MKRSLAIVTKYEEEEFSECITLCLSKTSLIDTQTKLDINLSLRNDDDGLDRIKRASTFQYSLSSFFASYFRFELIRSEIFRKYVWLHWYRKTKGKKVTLQICLKEPSRYPLDHRFGYQIQLLVNQKLELDHIMSCLSTLGGAFSSLGDQFIDCAKTAGQISLQQYRIAEKLGDPVTLMRCRLYLSISLIQCNHFRKARLVVSTIYYDMKSRSEETQDKRLIAMCLGIWAKLKYHWRLELNRRKLLKTNLK